MRKIGPGSLKFVVAWSQKRSLASAVREALAERVDPEDIRDVDGGAFLVYAPAEPSQIRDWLRPLLKEGESALVVEFEKWSGHGPAVDRHWLLARGH